MSMPGCSVTLFDPKETVATIVKLAEAKHMIDPEKRLKVLVAGGHPDDPESGCGGTSARLADEGHELVHLYLTRGEAGIPGKSHAEAAAIRSAEGEAACKILGARALFAGQIDGDTRLDASYYDTFLTLIKEEQPDLVFAHWPVDTHRDHRIASLLVYDAWLHLERAFALVYFEVLSGNQSQSFRPTVYVDITGTEARKRAMCYAHASQDPDEFYTEHAEMHRMRGAEAGVPLAEAYLPHRRLP